MPVMPALTAFGFLRLWPCDGEEGRERPGVRVSTATARSGGGWRRRGVAGNRFGGRDRSGRYATLLSAHVVRSLWALLTEKAKHF